MSGPGGGVSPRQAAGANDAHRPGRGPAGSRPRSGAGWAGTGPPRSPRRREKAEGLTAKPPRFIPQTASLPPENSSQSIIIIIIITPILFPPPLQAVPGHRQERRAEGPPPGAGAAASRGRRGRALGRRAKPALFGTVSPSRRS